MFRYYHNSVKTSHFFSFMLKLEISFWYENDKSKEYVLIKSNKNDTHILPTHDHDRWQAQNSQVYQNVKTKLFSSCERMFLLLPCKLDRVIFSVKTFIPLGEKSLSPDKIILRININCQLFLLLILRNFIYNIPNSKSFL